MREKIAKHYPGTKIGVTEYSFGGTTHISSAIAEADALGIFGREGVFAANYYEIASPGNYAYAAFDSYLNYGGTGGKNRGHNGVFTYQQQRSNRDSRDGK